MFVEIAAGNPKHCFGSVRRLREIEQDSCEMRACHRRASPQGLKFAQPKEGLRHARRQRGFNHQSFPVALAFGNAFAQHSTPVQGFRQIIRTRRRAHHQ